MRELTPEEIALGLRAVKAGWCFEPGDVLRNVVHAGGNHYAGQAVTLLHADPLTGGLRYIGTGADATPFRDGRAGTNDHGPDASLRGWTFIPDPTARGFVSAALEQVRERTGRDAWVEPGYGGEWRTFSRDPLWPDSCSETGPAIGVGATEAEAAVAALEATR